MNDIIDSLVEVSFQEDEDFLKIKETLSRIGVASRDKKLFQSCHILHKQGHYYITHFKEMFLLDGKTANLTEEDIGRRNRIVLLLHEWGLLDVVNPEMIKTPIATMNHIKILSHREKDDWALETKYNMGRIKKR